MTFDNKASIVGFIPEGISVEDVIAQDTRELERIGGSFEAIADRMESLVSRIENNYEADRMKRRADIFRQYGYDTDEIFDVPGRDDDVSTPRGKITRDIRKLFRSVGLVPGETKIEVAGIIHTRGMQYCPYDECSKILSSSDYIIRNIETGRQLWINQTTSHLARHHHLLEKGNNYGISAREFYLHFMPNDWGL